MIKKIRGAQQKSGLKPPPLGVDSPILANFLLLTAIRFTDRFNLSEFGFSQALTVTDKVKL